jgi:hypothetical protein
MIEAVLWLAVVAFIVCGMLVCFTAWLGLLDDEDKIRRDNKHRRHYKWSE